MIVTTWEELLVQLFNKGVRDACILALLDFDMEMKYGMSLPEGSNINYQLLNGGYLRAPNADILLFTLPLSTTLLALPASFRALFICYHPGSFSFISLDHCFLTIFSPNPFLHKNIFKQVIMAIKSSKNLIKYSYTISLLLCYPDTLPYIHTSLSTCSLPHSYLCLLWLWDLLAEKRSFFEEGGEIHLSSGRRICI